MLAIMKLDKLSRIQTESNDLLRQAVLSDRGKSWSKMAENYKKLLKKIAKSSLPVSFVTPPSYEMLLYESYYHFGVALQNLGRHKESIFAYTSAINSMNLRKNGCLAGCNSNTCFQTPVLAKRSFAYARSGDVKNAFKDIEKAVMLDPRNSDLYCIRALMWNVRREHQRAIDDLNSALKFNQYHAGALLLRGNINQPIQMSFRLLQGISPNAKKDVHKDHELAIKINSEASCFTDVGDVHHPKIIDFWNRFLRTLNIPRTVNHVDLTSAVLAQYNSTVLVLDDVKGLDSKSTPATPVFGQQAPAAMYPPSSDEPVKLKRPQSMPNTPFRCGTPYESDTGHTGLTSRARRLTYGHALRTYTARRQETGVSEYIQRLVEHASRPSTAKKKTSGEKIPTIATKPPTPVPSRCSSRKSSVIPGSNSSLRITPTPPHPNRLHAPALYPLMARRGSNVSISSCPIPFNRTSASQTSGSQKSFPISSPSQRRASVAGVQPTHQQAAEFASMMHGIEVFKDVNKSDAPRMYYKPWGGDKLPVAEIMTRPKLEAFRV